MHQTYAVDQRVIRIEPRENYRTKTGTVVSVTKYGDQRVRVRFDDDTEDVFPWYGLRPAPTRQRRKMGTH